MWSPQEPRTGIRDRRGYTGDKKASTGDGPVVVVGDDLKEYYAKMSEGMEEVIQHLIENLINFVQSREYVRIAKKFEK